MIYTHVAAALVAASLAAAGTWNVQAWRYAAKDAERTQQAHEVFRQAERRMTDAAASHEQFKTIERTRYAVITETLETLVDRPVYQRECLDADGVRLINAAVSGAADPAQPGHALQPTH